MYICTQNQIHITMAKHKQSKGNENKPKRRSPLAKQPVAESEELRPVFAAYFNMARANLFNVLRHISVQCGLSTDNVNEDSMLNLPVVSFADNKHSEVRERAFKLIKRNIPVLEQMAQAFLTQEKTNEEGIVEKPEHLEVEQKDVQKLLQNIIRVVNFKRNYYTHAEHFDTEEEKQNELKIEKSLYWPLRTAFNGSKREVKRIFGYTAENMAFVDQKERMKRIKMLDYQGNPMYDEKGKQRYIFVEHQDWFFRLFDTEPDPITQMPKPIRLSTAGHVFLLCKLLHKRYATQLAQKTGLFRVKRPQNSNIPNTPVSAAPNNPSAAIEEDTLFSKVENEVMFNTFCTHRIRLPKGRLESTADDSALGLDMLNELQKCPAELFDTLSNKDKKLFQVERKDGKATPDPDDDINLFRRNGDRFPQLALKYIDTMRNAKDEKDKVLTDIVFQVSLGKFRYKFYDRASLDTDDADRVRVLQKEINGFGPLGEIEKKRKEKYKDILRPLSDDPKHRYDADTAETKPYLTDQYAHYAITGGRIGITWNAIVQKPQSEEKRSTIRLKWHDGQMENLDRESKCFLPNLPLPTENIAPRAWLSVHDLPGLIFLHMLGGNPEKVIKDSYDKLVKLLKDISDKTLCPPLTKKQIESQISGLHLRDVPQKMVDYLLGKAPQSDSDVDKAFAKWADRQLDGETDIDHFIFLLKDIKKKKLKPQKDKDRVYWIDYLQQKYKVRQKLPDGLEEMRDQIVGYLLRDIDDLDNFFSLVKNQLKLFEEERITSLILKLEKDIKRFEEKLKTVGDKQNRLGTKGYVEVRSGSLARYIAKDIMAMTRPCEYYKEVSGERGTCNRNDGKECPFCLAEKKCKHGAKPSSMDFAVLQTSMATFKSSNAVLLENTELGKMLKKAIIVENHPFLSEVMKKEVHDTIDLYREYQKAKLAFLKKLRINRNYKDQWFLREGYRNQMAKTPEYMQGHKNWATRYMDTLQLPNGLFNDAIRKKLSEIGNDELNKALADEVKVNGMSHLLNAYFVNVLKDDSQNFYRDMKRHYKLLDWACFEQNPKNIVPILPTLVPPELHFSPSDIATMLFKGDSETAPIIEKMYDISDRLQREMDVDEQKENNDYGEEGSAYENEKDALFSKLMRMLRALQRNERDIRRHRNQDMLLFLMAKKLLVSGGVVFKDRATEDINQFLLKDIAPPAINSEGSRSILEQFVDFNLTINLTDENGKPIFDDNQQPLQRNIWQKDIKLKNYGDFYTFLYDSRIGSLLSQLPDCKDVERTSLEDELDTYDRKRHEVFGILQEIERIIIEKNPQVKDPSAAAIFKDTDGVIRLNNFRRLLALCKEYLKDNSTDLNDVSELLVEIRNAFSHNRYAYIDYDKIKGIGKPPSLPTVASNILVWLDAHKKQQGK